MICYVPYSGIHGGVRQVINQDYYIGLDCGTESVGFAVTDTEYNVIKFNGKAIWGAHLFDEAKTAAERRGFRAARRRLERKKERIRLVQSLFAEEIFKVDPLFFQRLNDSHYYVDDKKEKQPNSLFNDTDYKDKDFFRQYPTIYHLREDLRLGRAKHDPRLLYLAIHHIIKNRGHFLFTLGDNLSSVMNLKPLLDDISETSDAVYDGMRISFSDVEEVEIAIRGKKLSAKKEALKNLIYCEDSKIRTTFISLLAGGKVKADKLFANEAYEELPAMEFRSASFEEAVLPELEETLSDDEYRFVVLSKGIYDWGLLAGIMAGYSSISEAKVSQYNQNHEDLCCLKRAIRFHAPDEYDYFFHKEGKGTFSSYIGTIHDNKKSKSVRRTSTEEFYKLIRKLIGPDPEDKDSQIVLQRIADDVFLPLLISFRNSVIPYQVNKAEMDAILEVAKNDYPFLSEKDENGLTVIDKLDMIIKFRIPYYVGPIGRNDKAVSGWAVRKKNGKILPWNIDEMIDMDASAEGFIKRMTNKCTYLPGEDVLPSSSILYSKFLVLNELNNVRVNGNLLTIQQKQSVYSNLFKQKKKVSIRGFKEYLITEGWYAKNEELDVSGIDGSFKASLSSYHDFRPYIDEKKLKISEVEEIIKWLTIFSDGGNIAERKISEAFGNVLSRQEIKRISRLRYSGWGRLSEKFLTGIYHVDKATGEMKSIISMLWETQNNLMQLLSGNYDFVLQTGDDSKINKLDYSVVDSLYVSPAVKRQIWQTLKIVDEIEHIMKHPPKKVFVEVTRGDGEKGKRTVSRKDDLLSKLRDKNVELADDEKDILAALETEDPEMLSRRDKLYLYYTQLGKCMYTGEPISLADIGNTDVYDIDHIYPFSKSGDDSLSNRVLVLKEINGRKSNSYPLEDQIRQKMRPFWEKLHKMGLISEEKLRRLVRHTPFTQEDEKGFIARQLVETSQSTKATAGILARYFGSETRIVYSRARLVSEFRDQFNFIKLRSLNNLHHAKDAYLNIVVGNLYDTKYVVGYLMNNGSVDSKYNLAKPYDYDVRNAWIAGENGTIATVRKQMARNNILYTKQCIEVGGELFDQMPVAAGSKNGARPLKASDPVLKSKLEKNEDKQSVLDDWVKRYGGYNNAATAYFALVKHRDKKGGCVSFIPIAIMEASSIKDETDLVAFCHEKLGLNEPEILRARILKNTMISIDGYKFCLTGKTDNRITLDSAIPLLIDDEMVFLIKKIEKFLARRKQNSNLLIDEKHDEISRDNNLKIYDLFLSKAQSHLYLKRPSGQATTIKNGRELFIALSIEDQCVVISNLLLYFGMGGGKADLSLIGGSKNAGVLLHGATFRANGKKLKIFDYSATGLFEKVEEISI